MKRRGWRFSSTYFKPRHKMELDSQLHAPAGLNSGENLQYLW